MRHVHLAFALCLPFLLLSGCGGETPSSTQTDAGPDLPGPLDVPVTDAGALDDQFDATINPDQGNDVAPDVSACAAGFADCDGNQANGCEADLRTPENCGRCAVRCSEPTPLCSPTAIGDGGGPQYQCASGCSAPNATRCGTMCIDTRTDARHCGSCGHACPVPALGGSAFCSLGFCGASCPTGLFLCGGRCVDPHDANTCGATCTPCTAPAHASPTCDGNECGFVCDTGYHRCGDVCLSNSGTSSCGTSCMPCFRPDHATSTCDGERCNFTCDLGFHRCDRTCFATTSLTACGSSCTPCVAPSNSRGTCDGTAYGFICNEGFHHCGGLCLSNTSLDSCGSLCTPCPSGPNAIPTCDGTSCGIRCRPDYGDCNGRQDDGCETSLTTETNCGTCARVCSATGPHTVGSCAAAGGAGGCSVACESGWRDCDANLANGCEAMGACFVDRTLYTDAFEVLPFRWTTSRYLVVTSSPTYCRNVTHCFNCDHCVVTQAPVGSCNNEETATLNDEFDFSRVLSGTFTFYHSGSIGLGGGSDTVRVQVSTDGGSSWSSLPTAAPCDCIPNSAPATNVDLASVAGAARVRFRFQWVDRCDSRNGWVWAADDVTIHVRERTW